MCGWTRRGGASVARARLPADACVGEGGRERGRGVPGAGGALPGRRAAGRRRRRQPLRHARHRYFRQPQ